MTHALKIDDSCDESKSQEDYISMIESETNVESLVAELRQCLSLTIHAIIKIGAIIRRLEELGFDLQSLRLPTLNYFRKVAYGKMLPGVFVNLIGSPMILNRVANLPIPDQQKIVDNVPLKVMLRGGDHMLLCVSDMTNEQSKQVFASSSIRNASQQVAWLVERDQKVSKCPSASPVMIDRKRHGIVVGDTFISASDLAGYLGSLAER